MGVTIGVEAIIPCQHYCFALLMKICVVLKSFTATVCSERLEQPPRVGSVTQHSLLIPLWQGQSLRERGDRWKMDIVTERELMSWGWRRGSYIQRVYKIEQETMGYIYGRVAWLSYSTPHGTLRPLPLRLSQLTWFNTTKTLSSFSFTPSFSPLFFHSYLWINVFSYIQTPIFS